MNNCKHYEGNQYCNLHKSKVASAYCGDICEQAEEESENKVDEGAKSIADDFCSQFDDSFY